MKFIIFGIGKYYLDHRDEMVTSMEPEDEIVGFIDNRVTKTEQFENRKLYPPEKITELVFDLVIVMSIDYLKEMMIQLRGLGIGNDRICCFREYVSRKMRGKMQFYKNACQSQSSKRILIITEDLGYHGGAIAATYADRCLRLKGYNVCLVAQKGNMNFIKEIVKNGSTVLLMPALPYIDSEEMYFIQLYDVIVVNTFLMISVAKKINEYKPVLWWIHEGSATYTSVYQNTIKQFPECDAIDWMESVNILAVSNIAKRNFELFYPGTIKGLMSYGISDYYDGVNAPSDNDNIVFAIIGYIYPLKGQDIFLRAVSNLQGLREHGEFLIIGQMGDDETYTKEILNLSAKLPEVKCKGMLDRGEIRKMFSQIDVLVCASLEDSLPIVVTEAMMYGKVCIVTDNIGHTGLICDKKNGLVCKSGDVDSLCEKMRWVITHRNSLPQIGKKARRTYEQYFTMNKFGDVLERNVLMTEELWKQRISDI